MKKYILLTIIYIVTILLVIYFCTIYKNSSINVIESNIDTVTISVVGKNYEDLYNNISNYNRENHDYIIYVASYKNHDLSLFENLLEKVITSNNLKDRILYINIDNIKIDYINKLIHDFSDFDTLKSKNLPVFISFHDEKIVDIVSVIDFDEESLTKYLEVYYD